MTKVQEREVYETLQKDEVFRPLMNIELKDIKTINKTLDYYKEQTLKSTTQINFIENLYMVYGLIGAYKVIGGRSNILDKFCKDRTFVRKIANINKTDEQAQILDAYGFILSSYLYILSNYVASRLHSKNKTNSEQGALQVRELDKKLKRVFNDRADAIGEYAKHFIKVFETHESDKNSKQLYEKYMHQFGSVYIAYTDTVSEFIIGKSNYKCKDNPWLTLILDQITMEIL
jgi:hypothetical protein